MTPAPLQLGQAPSELALNSAGLTPLAFANALRIGSSSPVYVAGLLRREPADRGLVDRDHPVPPGHGAPDQRALAGAGNARDNDSRKVPEHEVAADLHLAQPPGHLDPRRGLTARTTRPGRRSAGSLRGGLGRGRRASAARRPSAPRSGALDLK